ncbi:hypothetical protein HPULCUR_008411 [Helicostylum pulchrum]|uniref:C2H2-type domain-containing protein n=1 Tax=Helicostylum pulchrum TaxID=562976 RepID=A0ABP9Y7I1_9FUNG
MEKEATSLPPPSALFGTNYYYPTSQNAVETRPGYILPPPSSLPGYHLPPPQYMYHHPQQQQQPQNNIQQQQHQQQQPQQQQQQQQNNNIHQQQSNNYYYQQQQQPQQQSNNEKTSIEVEKKVSKRKRRTPVADPTLKKNKKSTPPYHYEVLELKQPNKKTGKKANRKEAEAVSAAAATLASFASCSPQNNHCEDDELDECVNLEACAGQGGQFECEFCACNYRHLNCLQKHGWEHTEVRLGMTKQQQTQLLEAAQILMDIARYGMKMRMLQ